MSHCSTEVVERLAGLRDAGETPVSLGYDRVRFLKAALIGDVLNYTYRVQAIDLEKRRSVSKLEVVNQAGELVCVAEHILKFVPLGGQASSGCGFFNDFPEWRTRSADLDMTIAKDLQLIAHQEKLLVLPRFDADSGWQIGAHLHEIAKARAMPIAIDVRTFGQPIFYSALACATPDNADWVRRKSNTVAHFRCSSYAVGLKLAESGATLIDKFGLSNAEYATHGGGFPLVVQGAGIIGSITVSGLPQRDDHGLIVEVLCSLLNQDQATLQLPRQEGE
jgi:uncharacterized protein (UPF0303 family)